MKGCLAVEFLMKGCIRSTVVFATILGVVLFSFAVYGGARMVGLYALDKGRVFEGQVFRSGRDQFDVFADKYKSMALFPVPLDNEGHPESDKATYWDYVVDRDLAKLKR